MDWGRGLTAAVRMSDKPPSNGKPLSSTHRHILLQRMRIWPSQAVASSSAELSFRRPPSSRVRGHCSTMCNIVWSWPQLQSGDARYGSPHRCAVTPQCASTHYKRTRMRLVRGRIFTFVNRMELQGWGYADAFFREFPKQIEVLKNCKFFRK